jgi:anti-sigma regulatory factor (Ser/Thr protein kinase)
MWTAERRSSQIANMAARTFQFHLSTASRLDHVWIVRVTVGAVLSELKVADDDCLHVQFALAEAINNCIEHSYRNREDGPIDFSIIVSEEQISIDIEDDGTPLPLPSIEELLKKPVAEPMPGAPILSGGRGLQIIRDTMTSVKFSHEGNRNRISMQKVFRRRKA